MECALRNAQGRTLWRVAPIQVSDVGLGSPEASTALARLGLSIELIESSDIEQLWGFVSSVQPSDYLLLAGRLAGALALQWTTLSSQSGYQSAYQTAEEAPEIVAKPKPKGRPPNAGLAAASSFQSGAAAPDAGLPGAPELPILGGGQALIAPSLLTSEAGRAGITPEQLVSLLNSAGRAPSRFQEPPPQTKAPSPIRGSGAPPRRSAVNQAGASQVPVNKVAPLSCLAADTPPALDTNLAQALGVSGPMGPLFLSMMQQNQQMMTLLVARQLAEPDPLKQLLASGSGGDANSGSLALTKNRWRFILLCVGSLSATPLVGLCSEKYRRFVFGEDLVNGVSLPGNSVCIPYKIGAPAA